MQGSPSSRQKNNLTDKQIWGCGLHKAFGGRVTTGPAGELKRSPSGEKKAGSQHAGDVSHKPGGRLPLLPDRPAVAPATLKRAATNFAAW